MEVSSVGLDISDLDSKLISSSLCNLNLFELQFPSLKDKGVGPKDLEFSVPKL